MTGGNNDKTYGSFKVNEYTHGKEGYRIDEPPEIEEKKRKKDEFIQKLESDADIDYKKQHRKAEEKAEYKSTRDALKEFSFW